MFEKEAKKWVKEHTVIEYKASYGEFPKEPSAIKSFKAGAEFGYNKKEELNQKGLALQSDMDKTIEQNIALKKELNKANEWHYVKDGDLPKDDIKLAIIEIDDCGYLLCNYRNGFWYDANSGATCAEWITNNIIAWKEIVLPKEMKEND